MPVIGILEDDRETREPAMREAIAVIGHGLTAVFYSNAPDFVRWMMGNLGDISLISLDHDLLPTKEQQGNAADPGSGMDVVEALEGCTPSFPVIVHSSNSPFAQIMMVRLELKGWTVERVVPFSDKWISAVWASKVKALVGV